MIHWWAIIFSPNYCTNNKNTMELIMEITSNDLMPLIYGIYSKQLFWNCEETKLNFRSFSSANCTMLSIHFFPHLKHDFDWLYFTPLHNLHLRVSVTDQQEAPLLKSPPPLPSIQSTARSFLNSRKTQTSRIRNRWWNHGSCCSIQVPTLNVKELYAFLQILPCSP